MPVELTESVLRDALAVLGEWDPDGAGAAEGALQWMGWQGEESLLLRRYDVQLFVWYQLPRKFIASLEHKRSMAHALASLLERLGDRAASYAEVCRSSETEQLLRAWEQEDPDAWTQFRELLDGSGIEPPDTELLAWGEIMGLPGWWDSELFGLPNREDDVMRLSELHRLLRRVRLVRRTGRRIVITARGASCTRIRRRCSRRWPPSCSAARASPQHAPSSRPA